VRRTIATLIATVAGLVWLLTFKTTSSSSLAPSGVLGSGAPSDGSAGSPTASGSTSGTPSDPPAPAQSSAAPATPTAATTPAAAATPSATKTAAAAPSAARTTTKPAAVTKTVTGSAVTVSEGFRTFGSVQVKVTLTSGRITAVQAVNYPHNDRQSLEISQYSIPTLEQEVLSAQSANIDVVSGATYTTYAYAKSVQAALDAAKA
jgi:uncharacterized protein with FMN-binding domain